MKYDTTRNAMKFDTNQRLYVWYHVTFIVDGKRKIVQATHINAGKFLIWFHINIVYFDIGQC